jgi:hypothetical protein
MATITPHCERFERYELKLLMKSAVSGVSMPLDYPRRSLRLNAKRGIVPRLGLGSRSTGVAPDGFVQGGLVQKLAGS